MQKPVGVIIIALLEFLGAFFLACLGLLALFGMGFLARILEQNGTIDPTTAPLVVGAGVVIGVFCFVFAALFAFAGYGMWNLRAWARTVTIVLAILGIAIGVVGVISAALRGSVPGFVMGAIRVAVNGLILWYLNQPHVKLAFEPSTMPVPGVPGAAGGIR